MSRWSAMWLRLMLSAIAFGALSFAALLGSLYVGPPLQFDPPALIGSKREAIDIAGRTLGPRWPGADLGFVQAQDGSLVVERSWIGLREGTVTVLRTAGGYSVPLDGSMTTYGPGLTIRYVLLFLPAVLLPTAILLPALLRASRRRSAARHAARSAVKASRRDDPEC